MGLFDRKICNICGARIGLFGNRKLQDGNMCKDCAAKLSPWFSDRRISRVDEIRTQLDYRAKNQELVNAFNITRSMGEDTKLLLDEDAGLFMVSRGRSAKAGNPDVLKFSQITGCDIAIDEEKDEIMREVKDSDGKTKEVNYSPPRYIYSYDFDVTIYVNTPFFNEMKFRLNSSPVEIEEMPSGASKPRSDSTSLKRDLVHSIMRSAGDSKERNLEYKKYWNMAQEIKEVLLELRDKSREAEDFAK